MVFGLAWMFVRQLPAPLIGDNAYESDRLDADSARRGVELIAPHRSTRKQRRKTVARCVATDGGGRSNDSLPGSRTFGGLSCAMSDSPRTSSGCYTWPAASFCCGVYEMASNQIDAFSCLEKLLVAVVFPMDWRSIMRSYTERLPTWRSNVRYQPRRSQSRRRRRLHAGLARHVMAQMGLFKRSASQALATPIVGSHAVG